MASDVFQLGRRERGRRIPRERGVPFRAGGGALFKEREPPEVLDGPEPGPPSMEAPIHTSGHADVYTAIGWDGLVYVVCGLMGLAGVFLAGSYRAASRRADDPEGSKSGSLSFTISPMTGGCPAPAGMVEPWGKSVSSTSSRSAV